MIEISNTVTFKYDNLTGNEKVMGDRACSIEATGKNKNMVQVSVALTGTNESLLMIARTVAKKVRFCYTPTNITTEETLDLLGDQARRSYRKYLAWSATLNKN